MSCLVGLLKLCFIIVALAVLVPIALIIALCVGACIALVVMTAIRAIQVRWPRKRSAP